MAMVIIWTVLLREKKSIPHYFQMAKFYQVEMITKQVKGILRQYQNNPRRNYCDIAGTAYWIIYSNVWLHNKYKIVV